MFIMSNRGVVPLLSRGWWWWHNFWLELSTFLLLKPRSSMSQITIQGQSGVGSVCRGGISLPTTICVCVSSGTAVTWALSLRLTCCWQKAIQLFRPLFSIKKDSFISTLSAVWGCEIRQILFQWLLMTALQAHRCPSRILFLNTTENSCTPTWKRKRDNNCYSYRVTSWISFDLIMNLYVMCQITRVPKKFG